MISNQTRHYNPAKFLFIMDPGETLNLETETSLLLMQELIRRGHSAYWIQQEELALVHDQPMGMVSRVTSAEPLVRTDLAWLSLNLFDAVLVRKDPPFDTDYLQLTLILDYLDPAVAQFNEVKALREFNEKMLPLRWPDFTPPTLISMNAEQIERFAIEHHSLVLKPLNDCSGRGILKVDWDDLPAVSRGDKRVYLVNGRPLGMVNRIPQPGSYLANIHQGAKSVATQLSARENYIIRNIAPFLREHGIMLAGADFIGGYLTELNITSPSAVRQINQVSGEAVQVGIVDAMLEKIARRRCCDRRRDKAA
jgi:glutathione synthase